MRFCPNCGNKIENFANVCPFCGHGGLQDNPAGADYVPVSPPGQNYPPQFEADSGYSGLEQNSDNYQAPNAPNNPAAASYTPAAAPYTPAAAPYNQASPPYNPMGGVNNPNFGYQQQPAQKQTDKTKVIIIAVASALAVVLIGVVLFFALRGHSKKTDETTKEASASKADSSLSAGETSNKAGFMPSTVIPTAPGAMPPTTARPTMPSTQRFVSNPASTAPAGSPTTRSSGGGGSATPGGGGAATTRSSGGGGRTTTSAPPPPTTAPTNQSILIKYTEVMNKLKSEVNVYTRKEYQELPKNKLKIGVLSSVLQPIINGFLTTEDKAKEQREYDSDLIPIVDNASGCLLTDVSAIRSASMTESGGKTTIVITLNDELNPEPADPGASSAPSNIGAMFNPYSRNSIDELFENISVVTINNLELNLVGCTATLVFDSASLRVESLRQVVNYDVSGDVSAAVTNINGTCYLIDTLEIYNISYR